MSPSPTPASAPVPAPALHLSRGPRRIVCLTEEPTEIILQPGPACLTDGLDRLQHLLAEPTAG